MECWTALAGKVFACTNLLPLMPQSSHKLWPLFRVDFDPTNTTLFIGGLSGGVTEDQLRAAFARFGDIIYVKIPAVSRPRSRSE